MLRIVLIANSEYFEGDEIVDFFQLPTSLRNTILNKVIVFGLFVPLFETL